MSESETEDTTTEAEEHEEPESEAEDPLQGAEDILEDVDQGEAPDPADLEPITKEEAEHERDADGRLKTQYHAAQYSGEWRRVGIKPLVPSEMEDLRQKFNAEGDISFDDMVPLFDEYVREPGDVDWNNAKLDVMIPCMKALNREVFGGTNSEFKETVRDEIEQRQEQGGEEGN